MSDPALEAVRARLRAFAAPWIERGDPSGWFEAWYRAQDGDESGVPWADLAGQPLLNEWLEAREGREQRALVVGCGLGEEAERVAARGYRVRAFDVSERAIAWCRERFPRSSVEYCVADALDAPGEWTQAFDLVVEVFTLQALPLEPREELQAAIAGFVAPGGTLLVVTRGRELDELPEAIPWPLSRDELARFEELGLAQVRLEELESADDPPGRFFRVEYRR